MVDFVNFLEAFVADVVGDAVAFDDHLLLEEDVVAELDLVLQELDDPVAVLEDVGVDGGGSLDFEVFLGVRVGNLRF